MTPEIEKATQDFITATRDYNEAEQCFKHVEKELLNEHHYTETQQNLNKLRKQYEKLKEKIDNIEDQISVEEKKARKIFETLESNWDYKMAKNNLIGAQDKLDTARNYLERLIATEAEKWHRKTLTT